MTMMMMTADSISQIGETAGLIWHTLDEQGPMTISKLVKSVDAPRDLVLQAIGWLAREHKLVIEENGRSKTISLA